MTTATDFAPVSTDHVQALKEMIDSSKERPLNSLDRCDKCGARAQSFFHLKGYDNALKFCGRHTRVNLSALMNLDCSSFWVSKDELFSVPALEIPRSSRASDGDGLTDA